MQTVLRYLLVFAFGGFLCVPAQILICKTRLTPARILTIYVVAGVAAGGAGIYRPLTEIFGSGARIPLTGFGAALAAGVAEAIDENGAIGILTGGVTAMAAGLTAAMTLSLLCALIFKSKRKS
ncbi:MAG: SpoVA/SpoVAEb family sporulation membrane protein [Clostridia bacterium]|nr:SpoVA/SpoVAEb family sporulation membrane protein [Clostridia bacterium]